MKLTFPLTLFLIFLVLKLTGHISWSWWWVTAPLWLGFAVFFVFVFVMIALQAIAEAKR